ncbi:hypothetical protein MHYP_G00294950 [Metynnis hypsauchen]
MSRETGFLFYFVMDECLLEHENIMVYSQRRSVDFPKVRKHFSAILVWYKLVFLSLWLRSEAGDSYGPVMGHFSYFFNIFDMVRFVFFP